MSDVITREQIIKELSGCLDVNDKIGEEPVAFLSIVVSRDIKTGDIRSTITNICNCEVSAEVRDKFSRNMHNLAGIIKEAF